MRKAGTTQPGEEKACGWASYHFVYVREGKWQGKWIQAVCSGVGDRTKVMGTNWSMGSSLGMSGSTCLLWGWWSNGRGCSEKLWSLLSLSYSEIIWTLSWAVVCSLPIWRMVVGLDDLQEVPSHLSCSVIYYSASGHIVCDRLYWSAGRRQLCYTAEAKLICVFMVVKICLLL